MLKTLSIIPSSTSLILALFSYHYLLFWNCCLCFIVLGIDTQRITDLNAFCCSYCVNVSDVHCIYIATSKIIDESHPCLWNSLKLPHLSCHCLPLILTLIASYWLSHYVCLYMWMSNNYKIVLTSAL